MHKPIVKLENIIGKNAKTIANRRCNTQQTLWNKNTPPWQPNPYFVVKKREYFRDKSITTHTNTRIQLPKTLTTHVRRRRSWCSAKNKIHSILVVVVCFLSLTITNTRKIKWRSYLCYIGTGNCVCVCRIVVWFCIRNARKNINTPKNIDVRIVM